MVAPVDHWTNRQRGLLGVNTTDGRLGIRPTSVSSHASPTVPPLDPHAACETLARPLSQSLLRRQAVVMATTHRTLSIGWTVIQLDMAIACGTGYRTLRPFVGTSVGTYRPLSL